MVFTILNDHVDMTYWCVILARTLELSGVYYIKWISKWVFMSSTVLFPLNHVDLR